MQNTGNNGLHETYFLRAYVLKPKEHKYLTTPPANDYLIQRQRGQLEGMAESLYRLNNGKTTPTANTSYARTGTYDIASKLGLYDSVSFNASSLYSQKSNLYQKDQYQV